MLRKLRLVQLDGSRVSIRPAVVVLVLFGAGLALRSFRLGAQPLWLDELYGYQLAQLGAGAILENSRFVPHPPLYYLLLYLTSALGTLREEWAWRWVSALAGAASVPLLYVLLARTASKRSALLCSLLLLLSPAHVYFSQEARPYTLLVLLTLLAVLALLGVLERPERGTRWAWLAAALVAGLWTGYSFVLVAGCQLLYLAVAVPVSRRFVALCAAVIAACVPLAGVLVTTLRETHGAYQDSAPVSILYILQWFLAGDPVRYGTYWAHTWVPLTCGGLMLLGTWRAWRLKWARASGYHAAQVLLPVAAFFGLAAPLLGLTLPPFEGKQFYVLLPSMLALVALGIDMATAWAPRYARAVPAALLAVLVLVASVQGNERYFRTSRSPEGDAARFVARQLQPADALVSLHFSVDAALSFYVPDVVPFAKPKRDGSELTFVRSSSILPPALSPLPAASSAQTVRAAPRIWLLYLAPRQEQLAADLLKHCSAEQEHDFPPFVVVLVRDCRDPA